MYKRILVPVDGSPTSMSGLGEAVRMAALAGAKVRLMHVLDAWAYTSGFETATVYSGEVLPFMRSEGKRILNEARAVATRAGVEVDTVLIEKVAERVCDLVIAHAQNWQADLIVIGSHGRRGVERVVMGSDAEQIVRQAPVPVLVVRSPGTDEKPGPGRIAGDIPIAVACT